MRSAAVCGTVFFVIVGFFDVTQAQFEDCRCKCICPADEGSKERVNVTVVSVPAAACTCEFITGKTELECLRCECKFDVRSTIIIKVSVILVLCLIGLLLVYMVIMLILDPGILKRRREGERRRFQESMPQPETVTVPDRSYIRRRISQVEFAEKRWRQKVQQQRQDVFADHTILS